MRFNTSVDKIKEKLDEFVANGGNVNNLGIKDDLYQMVVHTRVYEVNPDGTKRKLSTEEKFLRANHPRKRKSALNAREALKKDAQDWLDKGNDFHVQRNTLPFNNRAKHIVAQEKKKGNAEASVEDVMKDLGFRNYSDTYYRYIKIMDLAKFQDEEGYVDSYVADADMKNYLVGCEYALDMPIPVVIGLIANQNMKKYYIDTNYFKHTRDALLKYIQNYGSLNNITRVEPNTYRKLLNIKKRFVKEDGSRLSSLDVLDLLEISADSGFTNIPYVSAEDIGDIMNKLKMQSVANNGNVSREEIDKKDYEKILAKSCELGCFVSDLFKQNGMEYTSKRCAIRFKYTHVDQYPCMKEMRELRDNIVEKALAINKDACKEEKFEIYMSACIIAYEKYKSSIYNFDIDDEQDNDESLE